MIYWSSILQEKDLKGIQTSINNLKEDLDTLKCRVDNTNLNTQQSDHAVSSSAPITDQFKNRKWMDESSPNMLTIDPFFEKTLPELLGKNFKIQGTFHDATYGKPQNLHPYAGYAEVAAWQGLVGVSAATNLFGKYETLAPDMAIKMEERRDPKTGIPVYWIHLRDNVYWVPLSDEMFNDNVKLSPWFLQKHKVTAHDFKFYLDSIMNPFDQEKGAVALRTYLDDIEELKVIDDLTFTVKWKTKPVKLADGKEEQRPKYIAKQWTGALRPLPRFVYQYFADGKKIIEDDKDPDTYLKNSVWAQNFSQHFAKNIIVSCGPWAFEKMTDRQVTFRKNDMYYMTLGALAEGMEIAFKENPDSIWQDFKTAKLDSYSLRPNQISDLEAFLKSNDYQEQVKNQNAIKRLDYLTRAFSYIGWNQNKPFFTSRKVRQALTMAIDRKRIIKNIMNGMAVEITGPEFVNSRENDPNIKPWPFDPQAAKRLLEQDGWYDSDGDGVIDKLIDGKRVPFRISLTYYVKNPTSESIVSYIATALKEVGIDCSLNGLDIADLTSALDDKSFDAILMAWTQGAPPDDPRQIWYSSGAKEKGSSNMIGFASPEVDKIIDQLEYEYDKDKRIQLYHRFSQILHEEQPYTFLYTPKVAFLYREYLQNVFIPADRQDLIPGADVESPQSSIFWLKKKGN
jgi:peptide/nickel transport system substrate-binding protein